MRSTRSSIRAPILVAALASAALAACHRSGSPEVVPSDADRAAPAGNATARVELSASALAAAALDVRPLRADAYSPRLSVVAQLQALPGKIARVGARTAGRVVALRVRLGQHVRAGDVLLALDTAELHEVTMQYLQSVARQRQAEDSLARAQRMVADGVGTQIELRRAEAEMATTLAAAHEAEEHLHFLGLRDDEIRAIRARSTHGGAHGTVRSPIAGQVSELRATLGQVVAGTEDLVTISDISEVAAALRIFERDLGRIRLGTTVDVRVASEPERVHQGTMSFIGNLVDPTSHTVEALVTLQNADGALRPGMTATASVSLAREGAEPWLPVDAVQRMDGHTMVFVREGERAFEARDIQVGPESGGFVPVLGGLREGEPVVVRGAFVLRGAYERAALEGD